MAIRAWLKTRCPLVGREGSNPSPGIASAASGAQNWNEIPHMRSSNSLR